MKVGANQDFLIYQPPVREAEKPPTLTPALWQSQMQKLLGLVQTGPGGDPGPTVTPVPDRHGKILKEKNIMKADQYPGLHNKKLPVTDGAPNYREVDDGIHGTAQPTVDGMKEVLRKAGAAPGGSKKAIWTNLREEPVVYVNGEPFNLRHIKAPFYNQASPGRTAREVEKMEKDLKKDILEEAKRNGGYIVLHDEVKEGDQFKVVEKRVKIDKVQTVSEVYKELKAEGYNVDYQRVPVTDMKKPEDRDIDELVQALKKAKPEDELIFNCHAGQGRTTTAMVLASMMRRPGESDPGRLLGEATLRQDIKERGKHNPSNYRTVLRAAKDAEKLVYGSQAEADKVIERYGDVHDLKKSIGKAREKAAQAQSPEEKKRHLEEASDFLERYHTIVSFEAYCQEQSPDFKTNYSDWKRKNPDLERNLERAQLALAGRLESTQLA